MHHKKKNKADVKRRLIHFIKDNFSLGSNVNTLMDHDSFFERGIIDSTGVLELVNYIEETFDITVKDEELIPDNLDSLDKLYNYITKKIEYASK